MVCLNHIFLIIKILNYKIINYEIIYETDVAQQMGLNYLRTIDLILLDEVYTK